MAWWIKTDNLHGVQLNKKPFNFISLAPESITAQISHIMNFRKVCTGLLLLFSTAVLSAQDIHFSQYYAAPLPLNPALTAGFNGKFRVAANYRNQWFSFLKSSSFTTYAGSFDMRLLQKKLRYDRFGVGVHVFNDRAGDGALTNLTVMAGAAYHKVLDEASRFSLGLGANVGITQRRIDFTKLAFEEQFDQNFGFDLSAPNGENIDRSSFIYPDFTVGILFRGRFTNSVTGYIGASMFHLHKPKEYFLTQTGDANRLSPRYTAHGGLDITLGEKIILTPGFLYLIQNTASEITVGSALGFKVNKENTFYLGAWFRAFDKDAAIAMLAYEYDGLRVGVSYDINLSDLKLASNSQGAIELSVIYIYGQEDERKFSPVDFCPKF